MLKKINGILSGLPATLVGGAFLVLSLLFDFPIDPAWVTVVISGLPLLYLAVYRLIFNRGISKISSALLITVAMIAAIVIGDLFAAGGSRVYYGYRCGFGGYDDRPRQKRT